MINDISMEIQERLLNFYDDEDDLEKLDEECQELSESATVISPDEILGDDRLRSRFVEEVADVLIMIERVLYRFGISDKELQNYLDFKIKRQLERIERAKARMKKQAEEEQEDDQEDEEDSLNVHAFRHDGRTVIMITKRKDDEDDDSNEQDS